MKSLKHISQVNEKNSKRKIIKFIGSILCLTSSLNVALAEDTFLNLDHDTYYDHDTIHWGYWFTAPEDLTITGIDYPIIQSNDTYNAKIYELSITESQFDDFLPFTFYDANVTSSTLKATISDAIDKTSLNIDFDQGDKIGVVGRFISSSGISGECGSGANECHSHSLGTTGDINGTSVSVYKLYQSNRGYNRSSGLFSANSSQDTSQRVSNIQLYYSPTVTDTGDATYSISGDTYAGSTLTAAVSTDDPDGNGTVTSYTWQSSSDGSTWSDISGANSSTYTVTSAEEGKSIRVTVAYTDGSSTSESVTASSVSISQLHTEWVQPYAAMQNLGLASMKNHRGLVLEKAGECNNYGWQVGDTDYCVYTNAKNTISFVNSSSTKGGYDAAAFNTALNIEKAINDKWKAGISYGYGSANLDNFNFSGTRANFKSYNSHYYLYGVKKASDKFTLKATFGGSDFDYYGYRNYGTYSSTVANSYYDADAFSGEINGIWNYKKYLNNSTYPIRLRPTAGIAYAIHNQDELSETGTGDLISIDKNQSESLQLKTGITIDKQIPMEKGKWILIPSFGIDLAYDPAADGENTKGVKGKLTNSTTSATHVNAKNFGVVNAVAKLGADIVCTKDLMFSLNATIGVTNKGDQRSYGGGFRWHF